MMSRLPLILVTGFLGSGKTTFLRRLAESHPELRMMFLVNEFADTDTDREILAATETPSISVVGGSLFCECKAAEFVARMRDTVIAAHHRQPLDAVVVETSGIADPDAIGTLLHRHGLAEDFTIRHILTIVSPAKFLRIVDHLPVVAAQVQASDHIVINQIDRTDSATVEKVAAELRRRNPGAVLHRASFCRFPFRIGASDRANLPAAPLATCEANPFTTRVLQLEHPVLRVNLEHWLAAVPEAVIRIKGWAETEQGWFLLERTLDGASLTPVRAPEAARIVLIAPDADAAVLAAVEPPAG